MTLKVEVRVGSRSRVTDTQPGDLDARTGLRVANATT